MGLYIFISKGMSRLKKFGAENLSEFHHFEAEIEGLKIPGN
jgi:hypothetical protein